MHVDKGNVLIEDKRAVGGNFSEITKGVCHVLEFTTIVSNGEVALDEVLKGGVKVEGALFAIGKELVFHGKPDGVGGGAVWPNDLLEIAGDVAVEPCQDNTVHANTHSVTGLLNTPEKLFAEPA